ncbi:Molybdopterin oxidoreductase Fe4S4 domain-containing protein [Streptomyces zhaozhouensis]|uniref:Molybdopterin oxidoreductase Fe4S4 domain-containing protein n=1 Tax=Streptomyces zhaozhouensis TaxID=1300267 RepID=A0A286E6X8_9ACTN|nr:nitrate reductase [Streptomyces zhaozhouensis]SOD66643.1 Molybdopterin oxidoreductase Fe4S4 domain-containing protein [Streptomyces zhaozhouensis]
MTERIEDVWGRRTPYAPGAPWPPRVDQRLTVAEERVERWVPSACVLCSNGCGLDIAVADGAIVGVRGRADDRVNHGRLGPKGLYGWQANASGDRLTEPLIRVGGELRRTDWDTAMGAVVDRSREVLARQGPLAMAFYTSGQLFAEEYYAQAVIARGGIGTPHLDGNTRLCTATAEWALVESFGSDGNPGSYGDIDLCDTLFLVGHNMAETQTVLWSRVLDRLRGQDRPRLVVVDPRSTPVAREADVHLPIRPGTNVALLNAILRELIRHDRVDRAFVDAHTVGFAALAEVVEPYTPEHAAGICRVPAEAISRAAAVLGAADRLVSTVLQGVYQSHQATAAAVQVNNVHLLRGMIGGPGRTVFQMNGQPTAQNAREAGANGTLPGFRNWQNDAHVAEIARAWNVAAERIPHWSPPTHAMDIFRHCEDGTVRFLWVTGTNPAVSLPDLRRIRSLLSRDQLFLVVSDAFPNETTALADVVLPAALWGEKTGCYTNPDRTVHLSEKAVDPPGQARPDFDILLDYARRMELRDREGRPLPPWTGPEEAWTAFTALTRGRGCDQSALDYAGLRATRGVQWPCTERAPHGTERLYTDHVFPTGAAVCEDYGYDLVTGAQHEADEYRAHDPAGRAFLKAAPYLPPHEEVDADHPLTLTTGRRVHQWHTRTKTGRVPELRDAAPDVRVELHPDDAAAHGIAEGDLVRVTSRRGTTVRAPAVLRGTRPGVVFLPFHYGYFDRPEPVRHDRAANELTRTEWDPVSKQPLFKVTAVRVDRIAEATDAATATTGDAGTEGR